ncbi:MAG: NUDIX hydrolase [Alphaproteobacteria bacterium]|nr:NUDIX hydrolase [Alphaproteobacteria bacterium]
MKKTQLTTLFHTHFKESAFRESATEARDESLPHIRVRDAATLIIIDSSYKTPKILMGKRAGGHKFLPDKFVFPGGAIDACDSRLVVTENLRAPVMRKLRQYVPASMSEARLRGFALAAIRETFEETGLIIGRKQSARPRTRSSAWQGFFAKGARPALNNIDFIGRAITPPKRIRRFDTRFFAVDASELYHNDDPPHESQAHEGQTQGGGELLDLHWLSLRAARKLDLPIITRMTLDYLEHRLQTPLPQRYRQPAFFFHAAHGKPHIELLNG